MIVGILLAKEMGAKALMAKSDSLLVTGQVTGEFQAKDPQMAAYLEYVQELRRSFALFEVVHVPREQNARADLLAKLASSGKGGRQRTVIQETLKTPRAVVANHQVLYVCKSTERTTRGHRSLTQETLRTPRVSAPSERGKNDASLRYPRARYVDNAIPALLGRWRASNGLNRGQKDKEELQQVYPY